MLCLLCAVKSTTGQASKRSVLRKTWLCISYGLTYIHQYPLSMKLELGNGNRCLFFDPSLAIRKCFGRNRRLCYIILNFFFLFPHSQGINMLDKICISFPQLKSLLIFLSLLKKFGTLENLKLAYLVINLFMYN